MEEERARLAKEKAKLEEERQELEKLKNDMKEHRGTFFQNVNSQLDAKLNQVDQERAMDKQQQSTMERDLLKVTSHHARLMSPLQNDYHFDYQESEAEDHHEPNLDSYYQLSDHVDNGGDDNYMTLQDDEVFYVGSDVENANDNDSVGSENEAIGNKSDKSNVQVKRDRNTSIYDAVSAYQQESKGGYQRRGAKERNYSFDDVEINDTKLSDPTKHGTDKNDSEKKEEKDKDKDKDKDNDKNENKDGVSYVALKTDENNTESKDDEEKEVAMRYATFEEANDVGTIKETIATQGWTKEELPKSTKIYNIKVEGNVLVEKPKKYTVYIIGIRTPMDTYWQVNKRYSELREFHQSLTKISKNLPNFTRKRIFNMSENLVLHRQQRITEYFKELQKTCEESFQVRWEMEKFLDIHDVERFILNEDWDLVEYLQAQGVEITDEQYQTIRVTFKATPPNRKKGKLSRQGSKAEELLQSYSPIGDGSENDSDFAAK